MLSFPHVKGIKAFAIRDGFFPSPSAPSLCPRSRPKGAESYGSCCLSGLGIVESRASSADGARGQCKMTSKNATYLDGLTGRSPTPHHPPGLGTDRMLWGTEEAYLPSYPCCLAALLPYPSKQIKAPGRLLLLSLCPFLAMSGRHGGEEPRQEGRVLRLHSRASHCNVATALQNSTEQNSTEQNPTEQNSTDLPEKIPEI